MISQNPYIFNDTVLNNILYTNVDKTREDAIELCKRIGLHETISKLPNGYDSMTGE